MRISKQDAQTIVDEMKASIHRDINIMDETGVILASTNPARQGHLHQGALRLIQESLPSLIIRSDNAGEGVQRGINLPVILDGRLGGVIGITGDPEEVSAFGDVMKRMTEIMLESARQRELLDQTERAKGLFVENWLFSNDLDWQELEVRGRLLGLDIRAPYTVAILKSAEQSAGSTTKTEDLEEMRNGLVLRMVQAALQDDPKHFCTVIHNRVIVLLHQLDRRSVSGKISGICRDIEGFYGLHMQAGISNRTQSPPDIRQRYLEAKTAVIAAEQSGAKRVLFYDQVSLEFITQSIPKSIKQDLRKLIFAACTPQEQAEFVQTIDLYFRQNGNIRKCAETLFIHRNTFQYRMDAIQKKTGYDLKIPRDSLLLFIVAQ